MEEYLFNIQEKYYEILEDNLGDYYKYMKKNNLSIDQLFKRVFDNQGGLSFSEMELFVEFFQEDLNNLWKNNSTIINKIKKLNGIKTYHFWVPFDSYDIKEKKPNMINKIGLYSDTILIDDPLWRATAKNQEWESAYRYLKTFTYGFHLLDIKNIIFADVKQPIALIVPSDIHHNKYKKNYEDFVSIHRIELANSLFNTKFTNDDELAEFFFKKIKSVKVFKELTKDNNEYKIFKDAFIDVIKFKTMGYHGTINSLNQLPLIYPKGNILGDIFHNFSAGYISLSLQHYYKSMILGSYPVFENNYAIQESNKYLELDQNIYKKNNKQLLEKHIAGVNVLLKDEFNWLGNIPDDLLIKIRKNDELNDFRKIFSESLHKYHKANLENIDLVSKDIMFDLETLFRKHNKEIKEIKNKYKFGKWDIVGLITTGTIGITGFAFPPIGLVGSILGGGATATDIVRKYFAKKSKISELENRPIGLLFQAYNQKNLKTNK